MTHVTCSQCRTQFEESLIGLPDDRTPCPSCGSTGRIVKLTACIGAISSTGTVTLRVKSSFSIHHLLAAAHFARMSNRVETNNTGPLAEDLATEYRAYVTGAILSAVSAIEATINEVYIEAVDDNRTALSSLDSHVIEALAEFWESIEGRPALSKYQFALIVARKPKFNPGQAPYQDGGSPQKLYHFDLCLL